MDTLAHGLWGGVSFGRSSQKVFGHAFILGMAPDLLSFGPAFATWAVRGFPQFQRMPGEPPDPSSIPHYVYSAYNATHSLFVWAVVFILIWRLRRKPPIVFCAWALHILCDIPTHTTRFFPTPYLWPLSTPLVNGFSWGKPWFMALNYSCLALTYVVYFLRPFSHETHRVPS